MRYMNKPENEQSDKSKIPTAFRIMLEKLDWNEKMQIIAWMDDTPYEDIVDILYRAMAYPVALPF